MQVQSVTWQIFLKCTKAMCISPFFSIFKSGFKYKTVQYILSSWRICHTYNKRFDLEVPFKEDTSHRIIMSCT